MVRAWYGVTPTGSQAGFALDMLANMSAGQYPEGRNCILNKRNVDDIPSGAAVQLRTERSKLTRYNKY